MKKEEKTLVINELVEKLNANNKIYLADCSSLSVEKVNQFRRACFAKNVSVSVVKNTLLEKALEQAADSRLVELIPALKGATALIFTEVGNAPAKLIKEFRGKGDRPILKGAYVEETIYIGDNNLEALANIKSKNELIGEVIGLLQSPAQRVISALQNNAEKKEAA
ncbi:MAG: 50S ribosomal protein L10 [Bacteroidetes bacterium]|jgi:large subunit ribosomal protein L10|nr:50S ribosomal protein L10 [Bacteroidota bacterium]